MIKQLTVLFLSAIAFHSLANSCDIDSKNVNVNYSIQEQQHKTTFVLIRHDSQVAHYYPHKNITDVWVKHRNNKIALNRYFEEAKRAIEYQPTELKREVNWTQKSQLITQDQINDMELITTMGKGCYKQEEYSLTTENMNVRLTWLPNLQLIKRLQVSHKDHLKIWNLESMDASIASVESFFSERYNYQSTDYADIGDNESDPFFTKMINLGFIEHSQQGFYNSDGENISSSQHTH